METAGDTSVSDSSYLEFLRYLWTTLSKGDPAESQKELHHVFVSAAADMRPTTGVAFLDFVFETTQPPDDEPHDASPMFGRAQATMPRFIAVGHPLLANELVREAVLRTVNTPLSAAQSDITTSTWSFAVKLLSAQWQDKAVELHGIKVQNVLRASFMCIKLDCATTADIIALVYRQCCSLEGY